MSRTGLALEGALLTRNKSSDLLWLQCRGKELPTPEPVGSSAKNKDSNNFPQGCGSEIPGLVPLVIAQSYASICLCSSNPAEGI